MDISQRTLFTTTLPHKYIAPNAIGKRTTSTCSPSSLPNLLTKENIASYQPLKVHLITERMARIELTNERPAHFHIKL